MSSEQLAKIVALCLLSSMFCSVFATQASERESQSVEVTFYQLSESEWSSSETTFKTLMSAEASTYCANNAATCGLDSGFLFTTNQVGVYSGPTEDSKSLKVKLYLDFPVIHVVSANSSTQYVVNSAAVTTILANIRADAETALGHDIIYIGDEYYSIDPDALLNKILIPVAFLVLFLIIILAIALHMWNKKKEQAMKKKKHATEKRMKHSRIRPVLTMENDNKQSHKLYNSNPVPTHLATTKEVAPQYEDRVLARQNALPPLPNPVYEEQQGREEEEKPERKERKRRKKEKRHQEKEERRTEVENEKSESETFEKNVIPVEDDPPASLA